MTDLVGLEELARAATPGPWTIDPEQEWDDGTNLPQEVRLRVNGSRWSKVVDAVHVDDNDAAFIAAANPQTILHLIQLLKDRDSTVEALEKESADLTKALTGLTCGGSEFFVRRGDRYVADIAACVGYVREVRAADHRRWREAALEAKQARQSLNGGASS